MSNVYEKKVQLDKSQIREFVDLANKCDFDVDIFYNHVIVDAKSILGVFALDFAQTLTVRMHGYHSEMDAFLSSCCLAS